MRTLEEVKKISLSHGFEFVDDKYIHCAFKHRFRCLKDNEIHKSRFSDIKNGHGLMCCAKRLLSKRRKLKIKDVKRRSREKGFIFLDKEYNGNTFKHKFYCIIDKKTQLATFDGISCGYGLRCCKSRKLSLYRGDKSSGWNPNLTEEDRLDRKRHTWDHVIWRRAIKKRDNYKCDICKSKIELIAHHLESYAKNKELRLDLENGVCLCQECHKELHKMFGQITTKKDYLKFKKIKNTHQKRKRNNVKNTKL